MLEDLEKTIDRVKDDLEALRKLRARLDEILGESESKHVCPVPLPCNRRHYPEIYPWTGPIWTSETSTAFTGYSPPDGSYVLAGGD